MVPQFDDGGCQEAPFLPPRPSFLAWYFVCLFFVFVTWFGMTNCINNHNMVSIDPSLYVWGRCKQGTPLPIPTPVLASTLVVKQPIRIPFQPFALCIIQLAIFNPTMSASSFAATFALMHSISSTAFQLVANCLHGPRLIFALV
jgi:hypothetical protein